MTDEKVPLYNDKGELNTAALIEQYEPFVLGIAKKVKRTLNDSIELDDLVSYGMTGLLDAAQRFDPNKGAQLMTFAYYRVRGAIYDGLRSMGWVSRSEYAKIRFQERANNYLENIANRSIGAEFLGGQEGETLEQLADRVSHMATIYVTSLEAMEHKQFEDEHLRQPDEKLYDSEMKGRVQQAIRTLSKADREIIVNYYFRDNTLEEVGKEMGLSKSWMSRRHAQAIEKLSQAIAELEDPSE